MNSSGTATVFQQLLGAEFFHLAAVVKALHVRQGHFTWRGEVSIVRGRGLLARMAAVVARLAPAMQGAPLAVAFDCSPSREVWARDFGGVPMRSTLQPRAGLLQERLGIVTFRFRLLRNGEALLWVPEQARVLGLLPLPRRWLEGVRAREWGEGGRYHFRVEASLPLAGPVISYEGWLEADGCRRD